MKKTRYGAWAFLPFGVLILVGSVIKRPLPYSEYLLLLSLVFMIILGILGLIKGDSQWKVVAVLAVLLGSFMLYASIVVMNLNF